MSEQLHVIYREEPTSPGEPAWNAYSFPTSIYTDGYTLEHVRDEFREAVAFHYSGEPDPQLAEHIERQAADEVFLRVAVDRRTLDREYVRATLEAALAQPVGHPPKFDADQLAATGDVVVICAVAADELGWVFEQMSKEDAVHVAMAVSEFGIALTAVAGPAALPDPQHAQTLADLGLSGASTVGEFITATVADPGLSTRPVLITA